VRSTRFRTVRYARLLASASTLRPHHSEASKPPDALPAPTNGTVHSACTSAASTRMRATPPRSGSRPRAEIAP